MVRSTSQDVDQPGTQREPSSAPAPTPGNGPNTGNGPAETTPPPRRRKRRWLVRLLLTVLVLILVAAVAIQLVLWSNLPKRLVLAQLQSQLGLRVQANALTTGWLGNTNLRDVTLALPMAEQSFLDMPRMRVKHTTLFGLLLRRPVSVDLIALDNPTLYVRRDAAGRWNLAEVAELIARAAGKKPADESAQQARPKLPEVVIDRATVVVTDVSGRRSEIRPLNLHGRPDPQTPSILYRYDMEVPDHVKFVGQVAPGAPWAHEVRFTVDKIDEWAKPWVAGFPQDARVAASWRGQVDGAGRLNARLNIEEVKAANMGVKGVVTIADQGGGAYAIGPDGLLLTTPQKLLPEAKVASGLITLDAKGLRAERVQLAAAGGQMRMEGNYAFATATGQLAAEWTDVVSGVVTSSGSLQGTLTAPFPDRPKVDVTLSARGTGPDGAFDTKLVLDGTGRRGWLDMDWTLTAPNLDWKGNYPLSLDGLVAKIETREDDKTRDNLVRLAHVQSPGHRVESVGEYNLTNGKWNFWVAIGEVPLPGTTVAAAARPGITTLPATTSTSTTQLASTQAAATQVAATTQALEAARTAAGTGTGQGQGPPPMTIVLNTWGDPNQVRIEQFLLRGAEAELTANGWYYYHRPSPVDLKVEVKHIPPRRDENDRPPIFGYLRGNATIQGTAFEPRNLSIDGELTGEGLTVYRRPLKNIKAKVTGFVKDDHAELKTEQFELLKSHWSMDALYTKASKALTVGVRVPDLNLQEVSDLLQPVGPNDRESARRDEPRTNTLSGTLDGHWTAEVTGASLAAIHVEGGFKARDVKAASFVADEVESPTTLDHGVLTVGPLQMRRSVARPVAAGAAPAPLNGTGNATVRIDTAQPSQLALSFDLKSWPLQSGDSTLLDVTGRSKQLVIDLKSKPDAKQKVLPGKTAVGDLELSSNLTYKGAALGTGKLLATFMGREVDLREVDVKTLDGNLHGQGVIELEKPLEARAYFEWEKVSSARLVELFPALKGLEGTFTGRMRVEPAVDPRALGPLAVAIEADAVGGRYNTIQFGRSRILAYADLNRFVLNDPGDLPSVVEAAGGLLTLWGRVSYHDLQTTKDAVSSQMMLHFQGLDLDQIVRAGAPDFTGGAGRLDGTLTVIGATRGPRLKPLPPGVPKPSFAEKLITAFTAEGQIKLTEAKLGPLPIFSQLYDLMSLGQDVKQNNGRGEVSVRMEGGSLSLDNLHYFNRGTEVRAVLTIDELWNLPNSPIRGNAVGSSRPLASLQLPFVSEADRVIALLQNDLISVDISGTLKNHKIQQIFLKDVGRAMQTLLLGEVGNVKGNAKRTSH